MSKDSVVYENLAEINQSNSCIEVHSWQGGISRVIFFNLILASLIASLVSHCSSSEGTEVAEKVVSSTKGIDIAIRKDGSIFNMDDVSLFRSMVIGANSEDYLRLDSTSFKESIVTGHSMYGMECLVKVKIYEDKIPEIGRWYFNNIKLEYVGSQLWRKIIGRDSYISTHTEPDDVVLKEL